MTRPTLEVADILRVHALMARGRFEGCHNALTGYYAAHPRAMFHSRLKVARQVIQATFSKAAV